MFPRRYFMCWECCCRDYYNSSLWSPLTAPLCCIKLQLPLCLHFQFLPLAQPSPLTDRWNYPSWVSGLASVAALWKIVVLFLYEHVYALLYFHSHFKKVILNIFKSASVLEHIKTPLPQCLQKFVQTRKLGFGANIVSTCFHNNLINCLHVS